MKMNKKGFTLIEMLVVIAIIAVLVSIVIPVVGDSTEKAREAADAANIRAAVAQVTTEALVDGTATPVEVEMSQKTADFITADITSIGGISDADFAKIAKLTDGAKVTIGWENDAIKVTVPTT